MAPIHLTLLHSNDLHGRVGQVAKIGALVNRIRHEVEAAGGYCLYFDAGDCEDSILLESALTQGSAMDAILRAAGCDQVALGNAIPFRYGIQAIEGLALSFGKPILCANMHWKDGSIPAGLVPSVILDIAGMQLAVIGFTDDRMDAYSVFNVDVVPPETLLPGLIESAKTDGAEIILLLSHLGQKRDIKLAATVDGINLIIGGHSHDRIDPPLVVNRTIITQAGQYGEVLGRLDLEIDAESGTILSHSSQLIPVEGSIPDDERVLSAIEREKQRARAIMEIPVGILERDMEYLEGEECRAGNLLADALLAHFPDAQVSFVMGLHWEEGLKAGNLTKGELFSVNRSTGNPGRIRVSGRQLEQFFMKALQPESIIQKPTQMRGRMNGMPHVAGMRVVAHGAPPQAVDIMIDSRKIDPDEIITAVVSDYEISEILDYLPMADKEVEYDIPTILPDVLEEYLRRHTPLRDVPGNRITFTN